MLRLFDYLTARGENAIREWASIEREVRDATHEVLLNLQTPLEAAIRSVDDAAVVEGDERDPRYPRLVIRRASWPVSSTGVALV